MRAFFCTKPWQQNFIYCELNPKWSCCLRLKLMRREKQIKFNSQSLTKSHVWFLILLLKVSLNFVVFASTLIQQPCTKLLGCFDWGNEENWQICSWILSLFLFANIFWINLYSTFIIQNSDLKLCQYGPRAGYGLNQ